jgi:glycosyltransferase involved in cell wall biosynthesis
VRSGNGGSLRIAFFPDAYNEVDGVANTSRHFEAFAKNRQLPFLIVHAGPRKQVVTTGTVTRVQLPRSPLTFPLDRAHEYDLVFWRYYREVASLVRDFNPDIVQITGPSDLGMLGAFIAHKLCIPLAASWQTNLHQYARSRLAPVLSVFPESLSTHLLSAVERWALRAMMRFYKIPRLLFTPNREMLALLEQTTGKPCLLMSHSVDTTVFSPEFRDREKGPFTIGYVGRLTAEKNVRLLAQIERALVARGHRDFRMVIVGEGAEGKWLRKNMAHAEFTGALTGRDLSRAFANMDFFVFPSETDTFGLAVLEALASGVPALVSSVGGPKYNVQHCKTGYIANSFEEFVAFTDLVLTQPDLLPAMARAGRLYALSTSWDRGFEGMFNAYEHYFYSTEIVCPAIPKPQEPDPDKLTLFNERYGG